MPVKLFALLLCWVATASCAGKIGDPTCGGSNETPLLLQRRSILVSTPPSVELSCGRLFGSWEPGIAAFRGLRYGQAPLGHRRWRPAAAAACTAGAAEVDGPICIQGDSDQESEDCLYLNVFVPSAHFSQNGGLWPVLVWIHGGQNMVGSATSYGPIEILARKNKWVLVALNYRLGIFGYFALRELSGSDPRGVSGNLGITDQQLALRWVQRNIHLFGGDPERVTIMGESSGGSNVLAHLAAPDSHGLFHRAISLSGSANITMDRRTKEETDRLLILPRTPCKGLDGDALLECLYSLDATTLKDALPDSYQQLVSDIRLDYPTNLQGLGSRVSPLLYVDGVTVSVPVLEALKVGMNEVPLLLQSMQAEMAWHPLLNLSHITRQDRSEFWRNTFAPTFGLEIARKIDALYQNSTPPELGVYALDSDTAAVCPLRALAEAAQGSFRSPVYWSTVTAGPSSVFPGGKRFAFHNWDFIAATEMFDTPEGTYEPTAQDIHLGEQLRGWWHQFAATGKIVGSGWKQVQDSKPGGLAGIVLEGNGTRMAEDHKADICKFWTSIGVDQRWWWIN